MVSASTPSPTQAAFAPAQVETLVFDVLGTVVDEAGSIAAEIAAALTANGQEDPEIGRRLGEEWTRRLDALLEQVVSGDAPWRSNDDLRRVALREALAAEGPDGLASAVVAELAFVGHRLRPWPDSARALRALAGSFTTVALSNADLAQLVDFSAAGGLRWHGVLSGELVKALKPDPAVYRLALDVLHLDPARTLMVAAHPWDLRAAAEHGMRTAYVARPGEAAPAGDDRFDVYAADLADLAVRLTSAAGVSER